MIPQVHSPQSYSLMYPPPHPSQPQINHSSVLSQQYQSHQTSYVSLITYNIPQSLTQPLTEFPQMDSGLAVPMFNLGDDLIACLNKEMAFLIVIASSRRQGQSYVGNNYKGNATSSGGNNAGWPRNAAWNKEKEMLTEAQESSQILNEEQLAFLADPRILDFQATQTTIPNTAAF
uniref:Uncharacterized protein n=1 Tax=Tanacetum cinerariifolium TaxID=118510 RepID=A0A6L2LKR9_TANCI|nr:hypothetical protein [Tanacetum cinerariifolium]